MVLLPWLHGEWQVPFKRWGRRPVKKVAGGVTTVYIGSHYEKQGGTVTMNKAGVVY